MALNLEVNILGDYSKLTKATKGAQKQLTGFEKASKRMNSIVSKNFARLAAGFGVYKVGQFLLASAKAAGEDQRAQVLLATTMKRVAAAKQTDITATETLISKLEMMSGVADDFLRPAMSKLVSTTRNSSKAQNLLKTAINASAKSGKPLQKVVDAISKAFLGNTKSLEKMFPELVGSKNALADLGREVKGQAAANADPFAKVQVGINNLKETIGGPLIKKVSEFMDSLFSKENAKPMKDAQDAVAAMATSIGTFFGAFDKNGNSAAGFLKTMKSAADSIAASFELAAFYVNTISGKAVNYKLYPHLQGLDSSNVGVSRSSKAAPGMRDLSLSQLQAAVAAKQKANNVANTYNITSITSDKQTAQEIIRSIQRYEKQSGKKYLGGN